jgi:hypothetical protein
VSIKVIERHLADGEIVAVDMIARRDWGGGEADHLAVAAYRGAGFDGAQRELVPGGDCRRKPYAQAIDRDRAPGRQGNQRDRNVVGGVEPQRRRLLQRNEHHQPLVAVVSASSGHCLL